MLFNVAVDSVVRHYLFLMVEYGEVVHDRLDHIVGWIPGVFYMDNGLLGSRDPDWLQVSLNILIGLFRKIVLASNVAKSNTMICHPGAIRSSMSHEAFGRRSTG